MNNFKIIAGIVLYNPDLERLIQNIDSIYYQVDQIILINNGSDNFNKTENIYRNNEKILTINNNKNLGIAKALNQICKFGYEAGYNWALCLDQDSISPAGLVNEYKKHVEQKNLGMLCCKIIDRNFGELNFNRNNYNSYEFVTQCITSASMIRLKAWNDVGGFYEPFFIDSVDFDMCLSLTEHGYTILKCNTISLYHEVGHSKIVKFLGKEYFTFNHSPLRYYYIIRNTLLLGKRHHQFIKCLVSVIRRIIIVNIHEKNRYKKNKMMLTGFIHSLKGIKGQYNE